MNHNSFTGNIPPMLATTSLDWNCFNGCACARQPYCSAKPDVAALVDLYQSTGGQHWNTSTGWLVGDPCAASWFGVTCVTAPNCVDVVYVCTSLFLVCLLHCCTAPRYSDPNIQSTYTHTDENCPPPP